MFQAILNWFKSLFAKLIAPIPKASTPIPPAKPIPPPVVVTTPAPGEQNGKIYGPDLSRYEDGANWAEVATDNAFGITKASEGLTEIDPLFASYWAAMGKSLEVRGAYHFFHWNQDPIAQAKHFLSVVGPLKPYDFLALDYEPLSKGDAPTAEKVAAVDAFLAYVDAQTKRQCWIYCDYDYFQNYSVMKKYATRNTWVAYPGHPTIPIPSGWKSIQLWQYTFTGTFKGVPHPCDGNVFYGSLNDLKKIITAT